MILSRCGRFNKLFEMLEFFDKEFIGKYLTKVGKYPSVSGFALLSGSDFVVIAGIDGN